MVRPRSASHPSETANGDVVNCATSAWNLQLLQTIKALHKNDTRLCGCDILSITLQIVLGQDRFALDGYSCPLVLLAWKSEVEEMSSINVGQVLPASAFSYSVSLRVRHPTLDLQCMTDQLRIEPAHSWTAGEPRRSQSGAALGGNHRESFWSASLPAQMTGPNSMPLELFFSQQVIQLARHREFLSKLQSEGGEVSLLIELSPVANASLTFGAATSRKLADLNIEVEVLFVAD
jgi:hypothetical protein